MRFVFPAAFVFLILALSVACPKAQTADSQTAPQTIQAKVDPSLAPAGATRVALTTSDGFTVAAYFYASKAKNAPGVILLHQRGADKDSWKDLAPKLVEEGFAAIAIDLRGHGETVDPQGRRPSLGSLKEADYAKMALDVAAAHDYLDKQPNVNGNRIGIVGASIGANLGIIYAAGDRRVRTVVALSPGLNYFGLKPLDYLDGYDARALYLIASKGDEYSDSSCETIKSAAVKADPVSYRVFEGKEHGTALLSAHPGLDMTIVTGWLLNHLPPDR